MLKQFHEELAQPGWTVVPAWQGGEEHFILTIKEFQQMRAVGKATPGTIMRVSTSHLSEDLGLRAVLRNWGGGRGGLRARRTYYAVYERLGSAYLLE